MTMTNKQGSRSAGKSEEASSINGNLIVNVVGGLGNQMFQYASARAIAERMGVKLLLTTDIVGSYATPRPFELQKVFGITTPFCSRQMLKEVLGWRISPLARKTLARFRWLRCFYGNAIFEPHTHFWDKIDEQLIKYNYMHGYWQSEKYFSKQSSLIRKEFKFSSEPDAFNSDLIKDMRNSVSASVHIRRGDYLNTKESSIYGICSEQYYHKAIALIKSQIPGIRLFVFSDDVSWVRRFLLPHYPEMVIVDHNRYDQSFNDMRLMSQCHHNIIANSSFSWWGAWLNDNQAKIVIAPAKWYADGRDCRSLVPESWVRL